MTGGDSGKVRMCEVTVEWRSIYPGCQSAKRKKTCACSGGYHHYKPQILDIKGKTAKTSSWEPFHGSCSINKYRHLTR